MRFLQAGLKNCIKPPPFLRSWHISETFHWQFWYLLLLCCIAQAVQLIIAGCSHTKPYYHPDIPDSAKHDGKAEGKLRYRLLLLGDGGAPKPDEPVLKTLEEWAKKEKVSSFIDG